MAEIDISFKIAAHNSGREMCRVAGLRPDVWEPIGDTLQTTERLADRAFRAGQGDASFVVYFEAYISWREDARWNILSKSALLSERERLPTRTLVFVLTPERYRDQNGTFRLEVEGEPTQQVWFREICLWHLRPEPWWETVPGLMALLPLCDHRRREDEAVTHAARSITAHAAGAGERADLLAALSFFGTLAYPALGVMDLIGVENMRESKFHEDVTAIGRLEQSRASILEVLETRFGAEKSAEFAEALNAIKDMNKLSELLRLAVKARSLAAFRRALPSQET